MLRREPDLAWAGRQIRLRPSRPKFRSRLKWFCQQTPTPSRQRPLPRKNHQPVFPPKFKPNKTSTQTVRRGPLEIRILYTSTVSVLSIHKLCTLFISLKYVQYVFSSCYVTICQFYLQIPLHWYHCSHLSQALGD